MRTVSAGSRASHDAVQPCSGGAAAEQEELLLKVGSSTTAHGRRTAKAFAAVGVLAVAAVAFGRQHVASTSFFDPGAGRPQGLDSEDGAGGCAYVGKNCQASHCCANGGPHGYQCYERDDEWASCEDWCEPGVHEADPSSGYDKWGNPIKPAWSCKLLGPRSEKQCAAFSNSSECPSPRCEWKDSLSKCLEPCYSQPQTHCTDQCTWAGTECKDACWTFETEEKCLTESHAKRCQWKGNKCVQACWTYADQDTCWKGDQCIWNGHCDSDPCSAPGEDCRETKCCSGLRGGGGMTCFEKDQYYAACAKACTEEDWNCTALGKRTKTQTRCGWAGESCASTSMCCNTGFVCAVKDEHFTGCVQIFKMTSFGKEKVPLPPDWPAEPKYLGAGQLEYEMPKAAPGEKIGTLLYCFMAYMPDTYEQRLMEIARANNASIFACDAYDTFNTWGSGWKTWDSKATTLNNIDVFLNVWQKVKAAGKLWRYDWTVKVDPDALIIPWRLKFHLDALNAPKKHPIYVKNNALNKSIGNNGFLGAVEVFTREALELYYDWWEDCRDTIGTEGGEDGFMKGCMDAMGVGYMVDGGMFEPNDDPALCRKQNFAAYHPIKEDANYQCCIDILKGVDHKTEWGECAMNPGWENWVWPGCPGGNCREPRWYPQQR